MVLFDRSWYNRLGVEKVMGFCTDEEYEVFRGDVATFERYLIEEGIRLIKYWLHVSDDEQERRFQRRNTDPRRRWKLSPMDLESRARRVDSMAASSSAGRPSTCAMISSAASCAPAGPVAMAHAG